MVDGPAHRVRARVERSAGPTVARALPVGYHHLGRVVVLRLPEELRKHFRTIGAAWLDEPGVGAVLRRAGPVTGDWRLPDAELLAGEDCETEVVEFGIRYRFDASRITFARGNRSERHRAGLVTRPGETVVDLFAGIGYFTLPAAVLGKAARVLACEQNPESLRYLRTNVERNHVREKVDIVPGDNRDAVLPRGAADRVFVGLLPSSLAWVPMALRLLRPEGGTLHVHALLGTREGPGSAAGDVTTAIQGAGYRTDSVAVRPVKSYGPGRLHVVVDAHARAG
ncbi:MAG: methyltransferase [Thermoplasmata archaeon]|nr:methyltransferase [Thermoplasmata archaeon]